MGRIGLKTLISSYVYNRMNVIETEYQLKLQHLRYHRPDEIDFTELIISKARYDLMSEITKDVMTFLKID